VNLSEVLSYIGGFIVFLGITILLVQNWDLLSTLTRVLVTLGSGVVAYFMGIAFVQKEHTQKVSTAFLFLATILLPTGLFVTFYEAGFSMHAAGTNTLISAILTATYLSSYFLLRRNFLLLFGIIFATWMYFAFTSFLIQNSAVSWGWRFYAYRALVAGLAYVLLGHAFSKNTDVRPLSGLLFGFGIFAFLGAALALGGWSPNQSIVWELLFPGLVFAVIFLGVVLRSKSFLGIGALYLMADILKITSEYFTKGFGWPLALVIAGLALIGVGAYTYHLNRKYLSV
jgi:hypothetical protein